MRLNKGQNVEIAVAVTSYDGDVNVNLRKNNSSSIISLETIQMIKNGIHGNTTLLISSVLYSAEYTVEVTTRNSSEKNAKVSINVAG